MNHPLQLEARPDQLEISTWVLKNLPVLPPHSGIAMETQVSGLVARRDLSETRSAPDSHSFSRRRTKKRDYYFPLTVQVFAIALFTQLLNLLQLNIFFPRLSKTAHITDRLGFPQCLPAKRFWTNSHSDSGKHSTRFVAHTE